MALASEHPVIVVGNGIVGQCTALLLARHGYHVTLVAPHAPPQVPHDELIWDSRIYAIAQSSQDLLERLQVWGALPKQRISQVLDMMIVGDANGTLHLEAYRANKTQLAAIIESSLIEGTLAQAINFNAKITTILATVTQMTVEPQKVTLKLNHGQLVEGQCVMACDGANSTLRQMAQIDVILQDYHQTAVVANFYADQPHHGFARQWFLGQQDDVGANGILALLPLPGNRLSMVWSLQAEEAKALVAMAPDMLCQTVGRAAMGEVAKITGKLSPLTVCQSFPLRSIIPQRLMANRLCLLGDSAHAVHPLAGQGVNLGLRDVMTLESLLTQQKSCDLGQPHFLRQYERNRWKDIFAIYGVTYPLAHLYNLPTEPIMLLRNIGLSAMNHFPSLKKWLIQQAME